MNRIKTAILFFNAVDYKEEKAWLHNQKKR